MGEGLIISPLAARIKTNALDAIFQTFYPFPLCAMGAAINSAVSLYAMPHDPVSALRASRCEGVDRTFKTVESMSFPGHNYFKSFVVLVPTFFTLRHLAPPYNGFLIMVFDIPP